MIRISIDSVTLPDPSLTQQAVKIELKDFSIEGNGLQLAMEISGLLKKLEGICPDSLMLAMQIITDEDASQFIELNS